MDFFEVHCIESRGMILNLVRKLLPDVGAGSQLSHVTCAALGDTLIVIQNGHRSKIKRLFLLNSRAGSYKIGEVTASAGRF
ncbi:MAG: hypothetical protein A3G87_05690 [Omnitrophica bacterium RIFCSPLOWO2_12_FULL_50_11]|nr:MAG: hypothetical protein A3G87_05690 [Omnitrophica bacterium RIFCSPLOWO2_12_FULL_50_11]